MRTQSGAHLYVKLYNKKKHYPRQGHLNLTYRCNINCIHCYCKGSGAKSKELSTRNWKKILDEIQKEGCILLTLSGGEPLLREDFWNIYAYAKEKGFIITLFTNGLLFTEKIIRYLKKSPPYSIEITLNGITKNTYESITRIPGSFCKVMGIIKKLAEKKLPLILKSNCLKQNKDEIAKIKGFVDALLGKARGAYRFKYDPLIFPQLNGNKTPCQHRLTFDEIEEIKRQDPDIWQEYQQGLHSDYPDFKRNRNFLYQCNSWMSQFIINPYGQLKFCQYSDKFSVDLKANSFRNGFYKTFLQILKERFKTNSKCQNCTLRSVCYYCPARAYLETGDEEAPVEYYCHLAREMAKQMPAYQIKDSSTSPQPSQAGSNQLFTTI